MPLPWQDKLAQTKAAAASGGTAEATAARPAARPAASQTPVDLARLAPGLSKLVDERAAIEQQISALTGGGQADPRYAVAPMANRRAEFTRWSAARDAATAALPQRPTDPAQSRIPGFPDPALRATPGEAVPAGSVPAQADRWSVARDAGRRILGGARDTGNGVGDIRRGADRVVDSGRRLADAGRGLSDAGRALGAVGAARGSGDPLDRSLERARDIAGRGRRAYDAAARALDAARDMIPRGWETRIQDTIPGLGRADPYVRETARKLSVVVGELEEIGEKADRLRETASSVRELKAADEANDDARRDRALARLQGKRAEDDGGSSAEDATDAARSRAAEAERPRAKPRDADAQRGADRDKARDDPSDRKARKSEEIERPRAKPRDPDPPLASDRLRARKEAANA